MVNGATDQAVTKAEGEKPARKKTLAELYLNVESVEDTLEYFDQIKIFCDTKLTPDHDYGYIPGREKRRVIFLPGAQKIFMLLNLSPEFAPERVDLIAPDKADGKVIIDVMDTCKMFDARGRLRGMCSGGCNSAENKYAKLSPYDVKNTLMKMSNKRAFIGAVLMASGTSGMFTQDMEDAVKGSKSQRSGGGQAQPGEGLEAKRKQARELLEKAFAAGKIDQANIDAWLKNVSRSNEGSIESMLKAIRGMAGEAASEQPRQAASPAEKGAGSEDLRKKCLESLASCEKVGVFDKSSAEGWREKIAVAKSDKELESRLSSLTDFLSKHESEKGGKA